MKYRPSKQFIGILAAGMLILGLIGIGFRMTQQAQPDIHHTEPVPAQFARYADRDWSQLWTHEIRAKAGDKRPHLKAFFRDCFACDWTVRPVDYATLLLTENKFALPHFDPVPIRFNWHEDPYHEHTWKIKYNSLIAVGWLTEAYDLTRQRRYLDRAKKIAFSWMRNNHRERTDLMPLMWHDHVSASRLQVLTYLWEMLREAQYPLRPDEIRDYILSVHDQMDLMLQPRFYNKHHNHGYLQSRAVLLGAQFFDFCHAAPQWRQHALDGMRSYLEYAVSEEGVHKEHSADYHFDMIRIYREAVPLLQEIHLADVQLVRMLQQRLLLMQAFSDHLITATRQMVPNGDTHSDQSVPLPARFPSVTSAVYPLSGYASFRNTWDFSAGPAGGMVHLFFTNSYFSNVHKHADNLGFHLTAFGQTWLTDAGYKDYNRDDFFRYAHSVFAHNTIVVDEQSPSFKKKPMPGLTSTQALAGKGWVGVEGDHWLYPGFRLIRRIRYNRDEAFLIADQADREETWLSWLTSPFRHTHARHRFDMLFLVPPQVRLIQEGPVTFIGRIAGCPWEMVLSLAYYPRRAFRECAIVSGQRKPYLLGWYFPSFGVAQPLQTIRFRFRGETLPKVVTSLYFRPAGSMQANPLLSVR